MILTTRRTVLHWSLALGLCLMPCLGCSEAPAVVPVPEPNTAPVEAAPSGSTADDCTTLAALTELSAMDTRTPVPLQPMMAWHQKQNMMEHLVAIQRIIAGLSREDWEEVARASALIESSPQMQRMCQHMGSGADGFTELALDFHRRADTIGIAARAHDGPGVLRATAHTLEGCTSCHATYRQDVVDAATWRSRTGSSHDPEAMHGGH